METDPYASEALAEAGARYDEEQYAVPQPSAGYDEEQYEQYAAPQPSAGYDEEQYEQYAAPQPEYDLFKPRYDLGDDKDPVMTTRLRSGGRSGRSAAGRSKNRRAAGARRSASGRGTKPRILKRLISAAGIIAGAILLVFLGWQGLLFVMDMGEGNVSRLEGVDVSSYQESIDWDGLADEGYAFAYIKATEGSSHVDPDFEDNWEEARDAGFLTGAYHFLSYDTEASSQVENFINVVPKSSMSWLFGRSPLPPAVDVELYGDYEYDPPSQETMDELLKPLLDALSEEYGKTPVIYANPYVYDTYLAENYKDYPIWISDPEMTDTLSDGRNWTFCQYTFKGSSPNVDDGASDLDLNVFQGSRRELRHLK